MNAIENVDSYLTTIFYKNADPRIRDRFLMGLPFGIFTWILFQYILMKTTHFFMKKRREGFNLKNIGMSVTVYIWSVNLYFNYFFYKGSRLGWLSGGYSWICEPIDRSLSQNALDMVQVAHHYMLFKSTYFLELMIFILTKKDKLLSFYLMFHHLTFPVVMIWIFINFLPTGHMTFTGFINSLVHVILYGIVIIYASFPKLKGKWLNQTITYTQVSMNTNIYLI